VIKTRVVQCRFSNGHDLIHIVLPKSPLGMLGWQNRSRFPEEYFRFPSGEIALVIH
jgi:hypothetical protein